ncbi:hypothetical protein HanIR_Chr12g0569631 [Helianthus annuus]|nr:hypothetical protein HanIR_Chr12g0569631 [Helianthus annuus]
MRWITENGPTYQRLSFFSYRIYKFLSKEILSIAFCLQLGLRRLLFIICIVLLTVFSLSFVILNITVVITEDFLFLMFNSCCSNMYLKFL